MAKQIDGFKLAALASAKRTTLPVLKQVFVRDGWARATNMDMEILARTNKGDGIYNARGEEILNPVSFDDYIHVSEAFENIETHEIGDLGAYLVQVESSMSSEEIRYYLQGVYCEFQEGSLKFTSTDGHRLMHLKVPHPGFGMVEPFILPSETVKTISSIKGGNWIMQRGKLWVQFTETNSRTIVRSVLIDGTFPCYTRILPDDDTDNSTLYGNAKSCLPFIKTCTSYGWDRNNRVKLDGNSISVASAELADLKLIWPVTVPKPFSILFNAKYLRDMIETAALEKDGEFVIAIKDALSPARFNFPKSPGLVGVLVPRRF